MTCEVSDSADRSTACQVECIKVVDDAVCQSGR